MSQESQTERPVENERQRWREALASDSSQSLKRWLAEGADPNWKGKTRGGGFEETALEAASRMGKLDHVRALLEAGADPNRTAAEDFTPLMAAVTAGSVEVIQALIAGGADVNFQEFEGWTAGHVAIQWEKFECFEALMEGGADPSVKAKDVGDWASFAKEREAEARLSAAIEKWELKKVRGQDEETARKKAARL